MHPQTKEHLLSAMHGEAFAHLRYLLYAEQARREGHSELADLLETTAGVEAFEHFAEEAELVGLVGDSMANLEAAIEGESYEVETMYREYAEQAAAAGDQAAADRFLEVRRDEMEHRDNFMAALERLKSVTV